MPISAEDAINSDKYDEFGDNVPTDKDLFVKVETDDSKHIKLYWADGKLDLTGNAEMSIAARAFFEEVQKIANARMAQIEREARISELAQMVERSFIHECDQGNERVVLVKDIQERESELRNKLKGGK